MRKGMAAMIPICDMSAPKARAYAARIPLVVMLLKPWDTMPSRVNQRNPFAISFSEMVGFGLRNLNKYFYSLLYYTHCSTGKK